MIQGVSKEKLRIEYLLPKNNLKRLRRSESITTNYMGGLIGVSRRQYELKERGKYPFNDYEMFILSKYLNEPVGTLFFD